jgi:uracil-DNA glycosylase
LNEANSHSKIGWQIFTDKIISEVSSKKENIVFILWGAHAQNKLSLIDKNKHLVLQSAHPSPLSASRGFFGCKHFSKTNKYLINKNIEPINW